MGASSSFRLRNKPEARAHGALLREEARALPLPCDFASPALKTRNCPNTGGFPKTKKGCGFPQPFAILWWSGGGSNP